MSHRIITIEREYASGGREIGEMIAERLGIPCYNREILQMASERCNVSMDYLETAEEAAPKSFLYTLMLTSSPTRTIEENLPLSDKVYIIETNIIRELAEKGDCVIVGRCASYILGGSGKPVQRVHLRGHQVPFGTCRAGVSRGRTAGRGNAAEDRQAS